MTIFGRILALTIIATALFLSPSAAAQSITTPYTLTLSAQKPEFRIGDEVKITIVQTNTSNHTVECVYRGYNGVNSEYHYDVRDEDGKAAEKAVWPHMDTTPNDFHDCGIDPGKSSTNSIMLSRVYKFDRPGKYVVQVFRFDQDTKDDAGLPVKVWSNSITITITG